MSDSPKENFIQKQLDEASQSAKIYNDTIHLLQTEERFVNFFKGYRQQSVEGFIKYYAGQKANWIMKADDMYNMRYNKNNKWRIKATKLLKEIYLKKLFNLQCRWVAGEMDLPGIEISSDFQTWMADPSSCPFVEPISPAELACYQEFTEYYTPALIQEDQDNEIGTSYMAFEFYHLFRAGYTENHERLIPRWFGYYDKHFNTGHLLEASLVRKELEYDYNDIWAENIQYPTLTDVQKKHWVHRNRAFRKEMHENPEKHKAYIEEQNRRYYEHQKTEPQYISLSTYDTEQMEELMKEIETSEVRSFYRATHEWRKRRDGNEEIQTRIWELEKVKEWIPLEANEDYREAISKAYNEYNHRMTYTTLPVIINEYRQCIEQGKTFDWIKNEDSFILSSIADTKKRILEARRFKGEPENFDFLKKENLKLH